MRDGDARDVVGCCCWLWRGGAICNRVQVIDSSSALDNVGDDEEKFS